MSPASRPTSTDYRRPHRPLPISAANRVGGLLAPLGLRADLAPDGLLATARRRTGLDDFGPAGFEQRLGLLVEAIEGEARLHPVGRFMARENLVRILVNRLRFVDDLKRHPEIETMELAPPVFVVGLQRTGTTLLHRLLACDPAHRFLASWEAIQPARLPAPGRLARLLPPWGRNGRDRRIGQAELARRGLAYLAPDFAAIHPVEAAEPEEDCLLFDFGFNSTVPEATWRVPSFSAHLEAMDHSPAYAEYVLWLKYLQWQRPGGAWLLKTPQHLEHLDVLLQTFPRARILWTHRDPCVTAASFSSMMAHAWGVFSDRVDPVEVADHWIGKARRMVARAMAVRRKVGPGFFRDVSYYKLVRDPLAVLADVYSFLGRDLSPDTRSRMQAWREGNPQHKHGRHRYRLEDFGLSRERIDQMFSAYRERFRIPHE